VKEIAPIICVLIAIAAWFCAAVCYILLLFSAKPDTLSSLDWVDRSNLLWTPEKLTERGLRLRRNYMWAGVVFFVALVSAALLKR
jgi:hypothetical protein